jgi:hypothetical protein
VKEQPQAEACATNVLPVNDFVARDLSRGRFLEQNVSQAEACPANVLPVNDFVARDLSRSLAEMRARCVI